MAKKLFAVVNRDMFDAMRNVSGSMSAAIDVLIELRDTPFNSKAEQSEEEKQIRADAIIGYMAGYCMANGPVKWNIAPPRGVNDVEGFWEKYAIDQFNKAGNARSDCGFFAEKAARQQWSTLMREAHLEPVDTRGGKRANTGRKRKEEEKAPKAKPEPRIVNVSEEAIDHIPTWQNVVTAKDWLAGQFAMIEKAAARNPDIANDKAIADVFAKLHKLAQSL